ncbi:MAG: magnesium-dependent phosphatase-1 [Candidatus Jordarchaeum sp.]|uniref:magnesium-dependent phosphatase-1 n=1 Tax=Candidatus Jordarchaeum sp. TaxID=2823881 RepID=UPI00404A3EC2
MPIKLVVFDVDNTLWQVSITYASFLKPPLRIIKTDVISDSQGETVKLFPGIREMLKSLQEKGILMSIASLNDPEPNMVTECFKLFKINYYFIHPQVTTRAKTET